MQWEGDPETLPTLLAWIMEDRVTDPESPRIQHNIWWGYEEEPRVDARISGWRWELSLQPGDWVIKTGAQLGSMPDDKFRATYKEKRNRR